MHLLHGYIHQIIDDPEYFEQPYHNNDYNNGVKDFFDFVIHGDESIHQP
jgi:predicted glycosyltransferase